MPRKVLGADPFARPDSAKKPKKKTDTTEKGSKGKTGKRSVKGKPKKQASLKRVKLLEPSSQSASARSEEELEGRIEEQFRLFEDRIEESLKEIDFEEESGVYFSDYFNIEPDVEPIKKTEQKIPKLSELYDFEELEEC